MKITQAKKTHAHILTIAAGMCRTRWDELDRVSEVYCELAKSANNIKEQKRDFKENDRDNIKNIPNFIKGAK